MATLFGDTSGTLSGKQKGKNQTLVGTDNEDNFLYGDAFAMSDKAKGGDDTLTGGDVRASDFFEIYNILVGDAELMTCSTKGGNDIITGGSATDGGGTVLNFLYGDARSMSDSAKGGNDIITGGNNNGSGDWQFNTAYGDAEFMSGSAKGGNDILISGASIDVSFFNDLYGDAQSMSDSAKGGDDTLLGGNVIGRRSGPAIFHNFFMATRSSLPAPQRAAMTLSSAGATPGVALSTTTLDCSPTSTTCSMATRIASASWPRPETTPSPAATSP